MYSHRGNAMSQSSDSEGSTNLKIEFADESEFENQYADAADVDDRSGEADVFRVSKTSARLDGTWSSVGSCALPHEEYTEISLAEDPPTSSLSVGAGLENLGNTCFLNAVIQCFTHSVPLVLSLRSSTHASPCSRSQEGFCIVCALRDHIELSLASSGGIVKPESLVQNLNYISPSFVKYRQEDAHEFLQCMLDSLHLHNVDSMMQEQERPSKDSFVKQLFGGCLKSQVQCCNCGHSSDTYEPLNDISLEVEEAQSLWNALQLFTKVEKIEMFTCENCKMKVSVEKKLTLDSLPMISVLHFKRFRTSDGYVEKLSNYVPFPLELEMSPFHSGGDETHKEMKYDLYAVVVHEGAYSGFGHYISFVRSSDQCWFQLDDEKVTRVSEELVLSQQAYILFYVKQGSPSFASIKQSLPRQCLESTMHAEVSKTVLDELKTENDLDDEQPPPVSSGKCGFDEQKTENGHDSEQLPTFSSGQCRLVDPEEWSLTPPLTPTRSPSPEIVARVPLDISKPKKPQATSLDMPTKALNRYMRGMPTSRRQSLLKYIPSKKCRSESPHYNESKRRRVFSETGHPYPATRGFTT
ncbi:hypothetical protein H6P81_007396 [Aristolochia fimbriata]|uniref:Ubiquitin carboxyl-terminal hydrolase n=1 Tax=Aristolochia fimbriata TaxID=158543 RepID=A0AAV7F087_ARIFI|nr:hypothetical protein H6P81_007396 [Aristolochia fimbriata]